MKRFFNYNKETGIAKVEVMKKGIKGTGYAKVHPDDAKYATSFTGLQLAELRATKQFLQKRMKRKQAEVLRLNNIAQSIVEGAESDASEIKLIDEIIQQIISDKSALYEKLNNPQPKVVWNELTEDLISDDFKKGLEVSANETETQRAVD